MGIIYQFAIRFIQVLDILKVDTEVVTSEDQHFDTYLDTAKHNRHRKLKEVSLSPGGKRPYVVEGIEVPEGTEVITFGNDACDRRGGCGYEILFYYEDSTEDYSEDILADVERNRFMIVPRKGRSPLLRMDYRIGFGDYHTYTEDDCDVVVFGDDEMVAGIEEGKENSEYSE